MYLSELLPPVWEVLTRRIQATDPIGLTSGIKQLDEFLGQGFNRQQLSYLVGDSGTGKSWLATSWLLRGAKWLAENPDKRPLSGHIMLGESDEEYEEAVHEKTGKQPVIVFWSLEMPETPVVVRMLTQAAKESGGIDIESGQLLRGQIKPKTPGWDAKAATLKKAYDLLRHNVGAYIYLDFESRTVGDLRATLDELIEERDVCLIVVDYFRLIQATSLSGSSVDVQAKRSEQLSSVAKDYDTHVTAIFDINRQGQKSKRVSITDMRYGVAAQYDGDVVMILSRDGEPVGDVAHLILRVEKNRFGREGQVDLALNLGTGFVEPWEQQRPSTIETSVEDDIVWTGEGGDTA